MPVITQKIIKRSDCQSNPDVLYLFGDNSLRVGFGGQAAEMRGEPNAIGVRTKETPDMASNAFFYDCTYELNCSKIDHDLSRAIHHLENGGIVVIPEDGLGTNLARLASTAPQTFIYLNEQLGRLREIV